RTGWRSGRASVPPSPGLPPGLHVLEDRAPDRVPGFGRREVEGRVEGERLAELLAAPVGAVFRAVDEGEVLVRGDLVLAAQALIERGLQALRRRQVIAVVVLLEAGIKRGLALARPAAGDLPPRAFRVGGELLHGLALAGGKREAGRHERDLQSL